MKLRLLFKVPGAILLSSLILVRSGEPPRLSSETENVVIQAKTETTLTKRQDELKISGIVEPPDSEPETLVSHENINSINTSVNETVVKTKQDDVENKTTTEETIESIVLPEKGAAEKEHLTPCYVYVI